jgi:glycosyltransferase involved in cell wall biosynthesis
MACGKPVIYTDPEGAPGYIAHGVNGLLVAPNDVRGLREALRLLLADERLRQEIGRRAREVAVRYTVEACHDQVCALADGCAESCRFTPGLRDMRGRF